MQHLLKAELVERAVREAVCVKCSQRPAGSEAWPPEKVRPCQEGCTIFTNQPQLRALAHQLRGTTALSYELATRNLICSRCEATVSAGDYCLERIDMTCPLARYLRDVLQVLEKLDEVVKK